MTDMLAELAAEYPQLFLDPDTDTQETYRRVVLRGEMPEAGSLAHYVSDPHDAMETVDTPAGPVRVVTLGNRRAGVYARHPEIKDYSLLYWGQLQSMQHLGHLGLIAALRR